MNVRELVTTWGFDIDTKPLKELDEKVNGLKENFKHLGELFLAGAGSLFALAETTAHAADEALSMAKAMGTTSQEIQKLQYVSKLALGDADGLGTSLKLLSVHAENAAKGQEQANMMFAEMGVTVHDTNGKMKTSTSLLMTLADRFKAMPDGVHKTALAVEFFGRQGAAMIPLLNKGSEEIRKMGGEAAKFGFVMSDKAIKQGDEFMETLRKLQAMAMGFARTIGSQLIPVISDLMHDMIKWYEVNRDVITQNVTQFVKQLGAQVKTTWTFIVHMANGVMGLVKMLGGLRNVMIMVTAAFAAWTAMNIVITIAAAVKAVMQLSAALMQMGIAEAFASGGMSLVLGGAAALAAGALAASIMSGSGGGGAEVPHNSMPTLPTFGASGPSPAAAASGGTTNMMSLAPTINVMLPPGSSEEHGKEVAKHAGHYMDFMMQKSAAASAGGKEY